MNPNITIVDCSTGLTETREMTNEEYGQWQQEVSELPPFPETTNETPSPA
jgi:hypothetical protein